MAVNRPMTSLAVLGLTASLLAGCNPFHSAAGGPSEAVAEAIRGSALVDRADYLPANILDPAVINVYLKEGASDAEADALWCSVVIPAAGPDAAMRVVIWNSTGTDNVGSDQPEC